MDRFHRLAEMVMHLTGCDPNIAVAAVARATDKQPETMDDALLIVARAINTVPKVDLRSTVDLRESNEVPSR